MSYLITYGTVRHNSHHRTWIRIGLTVGFFSCFCWWVMNFWQDGREALKLLLGNEWDHVNTEAAEVFAQELACGYKLTDAARNFFAAVLSSGYSN